MFRYEITEGKKNRPVAGSEPDHRYTPATSQKMFLDREGGENEYEPKYLKKLSDYYKKMGLMSEASLPLQRDLYGGIEAALLQSGFYKLDNEETEGVTSGFLGFKEQTDAAQAAEEALDSFFAIANIPLDVEVISIDESSIKNNDKSKLQSADNPDSFVVGAQMAMFEKGAKKDRGALLLFAVIASESFDKSKIAPSNMVSNFSTIIRHELIHDRQYDSLARDMGVSRLEAKKQFEDWGLVPADDEPREKYLGSHIEVDAFGHEFAERLSQNLGVKRAIELVSSQDMSSLQKVAKRIGLDDNFSEYFELYPEEKFTKNLLKKIKKNLIVFQEQGIYK